MKEKLFIGIGSEIGTRHCPPLIRSFQSAVNRASLAEGRARHFQTYHGFHVALRVSGEVKSYAPDPDAKPRKMRGKPYVTIEWVLTEDDWRDQTDETFFLLLTQGLTICFDKLMAFARTNGELLDEDLSRRVFQDILAQTQPDM